MSAVKGDAALLLLADSRLPAGGHAHSGGVEEAVRLGAVTGTDDLARFLRGRLATSGLVTAALAAAACELAVSEVVRGPAAGRGGGAGADADADADADGEPVAALWRRLDAEADARTASPAQREASRTQGRLLLRTARRMWPSAALDVLVRAVPDGPHHPVALGAVAASAGCEPLQAALAAAYATVTGPATAAVRLLGLDPVAVHRLLAGLAPALDETAHAACESLPDALPLDDEPYDEPYEEPGEEPDDRGTGRHAGRRAAWRALPGHGAPALDLLAEGHLTNPAKLFVS
ncbi:urease accessory UreF family protein [Microbispora sp. ZYX-F-249]|uniref:Urease accessory protein UreF n=1 Tax=Microbispora maris TaxID=3144104 RepID=A0ABV0AQV9_9ACTN